MADDGSDLCFITAQTAECEIRDHAYRCDDGTEVVHCFRGSIGADWSVEGAVSLAQRAERIAWGTHPFWGRCLLVEAEGKVYAFDGVTP